MNRHKRTRDCGISLAGQSATHGNQPVHQGNRPRRARRAAARPRAGRATCSARCSTARVTDLEIGAFCLAMRIKGETPEEMAGFLDATHARLRPLSRHRPAAGRAAQLQRRAQAAGADAAAGAAAGARRPAGAGARRGHRIDPRAGVATCSRRSTCRRSPAMRPIADGEVGLRADRAAAAPASSACSTCAAWSACAIPATAGQADAARRRARAWWSAATRIPSTPNRWPRPSS